MRIALFVEAGHDILPPHRNLPMVRIWAEILASALGIHRFDPIIPISKKHLVAMDPSQPTMSGASEGLDQLLVRKLQEKPAFDAAVVAWDLVPAWNPQGTFCRWQETVALYRLLAQRGLLPHPWHEHAAARHRDLVGRPTPAARIRPPKLAHGAVLALCMDPMFEALLVANEGAVRRALDLTGQQVHGWPSGWKEARRRPDLDLLQPAVLATRRHAPAPGVVRKIRGDFRIHKNDWGAHLLEQLLANPEARDQVLSHPICQRLREIASLPS